MEWYGNTIAVTMHDLTRSDDGEAIMSGDCYKKLVTRGRLTMLRCGKGLGSYALVDYATMPVRFRTRFEAKYGDPEKIMRQENMELAADAAAQRFFHDYLLPNGEHLPEAKQAEYTLNARVLNALREMFNTQRAMRRACNNNTPVIWANIFAGEILQQQHAQDNSRGGTSDRGAAALARAGLYDAAAARRV